MYFMEQSRMCRICDGFMFGYCESCRLGGKMVELKNGVSKMMTDEFLNGVKNHGFFKSPHEAWGVIEEEVIEAQQEMTHLKGEMEVFKSAVMCDNHTSTGRAAREIKVKAMLLACEAIQVGAMAQKYLEGTVTKLERMEGGLK